MLALPERVLIYTGTSANVAEKQTKPNPCNKQIKSADYIVDYLRENKTCSLLDQLYFVKHYFFK